MMSFIGVDDLDHDTALDGRQSAIFHCERTCPNDGETSSAVHQTQGSHELAKTWRHATELPALCVALGNLAWCPNTALRQDTGSHPRYTRVHSSQ